MAVKKPYMNAILANPLRQKPSSAINPSIYMDGEDGDGESIYENPTYLPKGSQALENYYKMSGAFEVLPAIKFQKKGKALEVVSELTGERKVLRDKDMHIFLDTFELTPDDVGQDTWRVPDVPGVFLSAVNPVLGKKVTDDVKKLIREIKQNNPKITSPALAYEVKTRTGVSISEGYIRRILKEKGVHPITRGQKNKKTGVNAMGMVIDDPRSNAVNPATLTPEFVAALKKYLGSSQFGKRGHKSFASMARDMHNAGWRGRGVTAGTIKHLARGDSSVEKLIRRKFKYPSYTALPTQLQKHLFKEGHASTTKGKHPRAALRGEYGAPYSERERVIWEADTTLRKPRKSKGAIKVKGRGKGKSKGRGAIKSKGRKGAIQVLPEAEDHENENEEFELGSNPIVVQDDMEFAGNPLRSMSDRQLEALVKAQRNRWGKVGKRTREEAKRRGLSAANPITYRGQALARSTFLDGPIGGAAMFGAFYGLGWVSNMALGFIGKNVKTEGTKRVIDKVVKVVGGLALTWAVDLAADRVKFLRNRKERLLQGLWDATALLFIQDSANVTAQTTQTNPQEQSPGMSISEEQGTEQPCANPPCGDNTTEIIGYIPGLDEESTEVTEVSDKPKEFQLTGTVVSAKVLDLDMDEEPFGSAEDYMGI